MTFKPLQHIEMSHTKSGTIGSEKQLRPAIHFQVKFIQDGEDRFYSWGGIIGNKNNIKAIKKVYIEGLKGLIRNKYNLIYHSQYETEIKTIGQDIKDE